MKKICAWCEKDLPPVAGDGEYTDVITHGICDACAAALVTRPRRGILEFLDELEQPVFLIDDNTRFVSANAEESDHISKREKEVVIVLPKEAYTSEEDK